MAAVKGLTVFHYSAGCIFISFGTTQLILTTLKIEYLLLANYNAVDMKRLNKTGSPIFVLLCVLCFQRQPF